MHNSEKTVSSRTIFQLNKTNMYISSYFYHTYLVPRDTYNYFCGATSPPKNLCCSVLVRCHCFHKSNKKSSHLSDTSSFHSKFFAMPWARLLRGLWLFRSLFRSRSLSRWVLVGKDGLSVEKENKHKMNQLNE